MSPAARIVHLRNCRGISTITGPETYLLNLAAGIDRRAFELHLVCPFNPGGPRPVFRELLSGHPGFSDRHVPIDMPHPFSLADMRAARERLRRADFALLHTHDARSDFIGLPLARALGRRSVATAHGWVNWDRRLSKQRVYAALETLFIRLADRVVVHSRAMETDLCGRGIPRGRIRRIPYGIDVARFRSAGHRADVRRELGIDADVPLVGTVARFQPWKGHRFFLEAAAAIARSCPSARFVLVGDVASEADREYRDEVLRLAETLGVAPRCHFLGTRTDIARILGALDVFVLSSTREPFGIVLLEAQACAVPPVSFAVDGTPEALQDGTTGLLARPRDSRALADAVLRLLEDPELRRAMGAAGPPWVAEHYSVEAMARATESVYRELL